ncbi:uncharacterized protein LOC133798485 [Humulus lupulus]|uniref:uncharacterized protein LOC133798485 n=1 Tax=Humulus lupulus TaxID=3486 RepID=UPI002B4103F3|nr:uncharacterized protein LOC133798485 [Humulus lupulus]XP_062092752.1 uncharacterized protein LOC133798485 [Humulus lupulus]XP_062092753.1 uncharacterized protein LOC133798485 [Humulus lupulus]
MEGKRSTPSVIARLMGLDEHQPPEAVQKPQRVLSENYLRKVASIGVGKKRSFHERHSLRPTFEEKKESKDFFQVAKILKGDKHLELRVNKRKGDLDLSVQKCVTGEEFQDSSELDYFQKGIPKRNSLFSNRLHDMQGSLALSHSNDTTLLKSYNSAGRDVDICRNSKSKSERISFRSFQKHKNDTITCSNQEELGISFHDFGRSELVRRQYESSSSYMRIVDFKPLSAEAKSSEGYFFSPSSKEGSHLGDSKCTGFPSPGSGTIPNEVKNVQCNVESIKERSTASREILEELKRRKIWRNLGFSTKNSSLGLCGGDPSAIKSEMLSPPSTRSSDLRKKYQSFSSSDKSNLSIKSKKQLPERCLLSEKCKVEPASISWPRNRKPGNGRHGLGGLVLSKFAKQQSRYEAYSNRWYLGLEESLNQARSKMIRYDSIDKGSESNDLNSDSVRDMVVDTETEIADKPSGESESEQLESTMCICLEEDDGDSSSLATDTSVQQDSSNGFQEESSVFSHCSSTELESLMSFEETYQPSPVSVLELPFSSESLGRVKDDICDLKRQLQLLKSKASEEYKEGSGMVVSSDDETEEGSPGNSKENDAFMKVFKVEESRNFSYLVELLTEAGLLGKNLQEFSTWDSSECPISVSVFETLEKKYGDQMSWKRSERLLLFDSIKAELVKMLLPCIAEPTWEKTVSRRLSPIRDEEMIVEDLWKLLVSQEKEHTKNSTETVMESELGKLDLGDEIYLIGIEIEQMLFDEFAAELFSM